MNLIKGLHIKRGDVTRVSGKERGKAESWDQKKRSAHCFARDESGDKMVAIAAIDDDDDVLCD